MSIPGLPALPAAIAGLFSEVALLTSDGVSSSSSSGSQWGIFLNGAAVVIADNVVSVDFRQDFTISNYPIEGGAFASYNKVQHPFEVKIGFSTGGGNADRASMFNSIAAIISDTNFYDVVTPEITYTNLNLTHQDYRRNAQNVGLPVVDVWCEEVRPAQLATSGTPTTATPTGGATTATSGTSFDDRYSAINDPQSPSASPQVNGGTVQPVTPTAAQNTQFEDAAAAGALND